MRFDGVTQRLISLNHVVVLAAYSFALNDPASLKISDDSLHGSLSDPHLQRNLPEGQ